MSNLKADLEQLKRTLKIFEYQSVAFDSPNDEIVPEIDIEEQRMYTLMGLGEQLAERGVEWLERAIEAEALNRELGRALESVSEQLSSTLGVPIPDHIRELLTKPRRCWGIG